MADKIKFGFDQSEAFVSDQVKCNIGYYLKLNMIYDTIIPFV